MVTAGRRIDRGDRLVGGGNPRPARDVARGSVGVAGGDGKACRRPFPQNDFRRGDLDADKRLLFRRRAGAAGGDPLRQQRVVGAGGVEPQAPFVGDGHGGLGEEEARTGIGGVDAAAERFAGDGEMVGVGIVAEERQPEAPLAGQRSMAASGVAAGLGEDGDDVEGEARRVGAGRGREEGDGGEEGWDVGHGVGAARGYGEKTVSV